MRLSQVIAAFEPSIQVLLMTMWQKFQTRYPDSFLQHSAENIQKISKFWVSSEFMYQACLQNPALITVCLENQKPEETFSVLAQDLAFCLNDVKTLTQLNQKLFQFKLEKSAILIWQQIVERYDLNVLLEWTSVLADVILKATLNWCYTHLAQRYGTPKTSEGMEVPLYILALGKLGGRELNFSSDVDVMFVFSENGSLNSHGKTITHQAFFVKVVQLMLQVLMPSTSQTRIYRVDLRLRPYGNSGALVSSYFALEKYYQEQGRDWERYALVKARIINTDHAASPLKRLVSTFVYRKYIDYTAFSALRDMKRMINTQSQAYTKYQDIKRGKGGIREIEFIAQAFQIIKGGKVKRLQTTGLISAITYCTDEGLFSLLDAKTLIAAYLYLRELENCLQMFNDQQVHDLPQDTLIQHRIACAMSLESWAAVLFELQQYQLTVSALFFKMISPEKEDETKNMLNLLAMDITDEAIKTYLNTLGITTEHTALIESLNKLKHYVYSRAATPTARKRMTRLLPKLFEMLAKEAFPSKLLQVLLPLLTAISLRSAYLVLLLENSNTLSWLIQLAKTSDWFIQRITEFPILLDELLDFQLAHVPLSSEYLHKTLTDLTRDVSACDIESQMACLRELKLKTELLIAIQAMNQLLSATQVNLLLTELAEIIVKRVYQWAWQIVTHKYGTLDKAVSWQKSHCTIVAYGNLGALAMNYQSDLDLILIFDTAQTQVTVGNKSITAMEFYTKLFQRMLTMLGMRTTNGVLYDIDTRLRPSGNQGLLVVTLKGFIHYQKERAWTYEHQALTRARCVAGDLMLANKFQAARMQVLTCDVNLLVLKDNLLSMREKLKQQREGAYTDTKSFKNCAGGITDIDFMVQYSILKYAREHPALLAHTATEHFLLALGKFGVLSEKSATQLIKIYQFYQACLQQLALVGELTSESIKKMHQYQQIVQIFWQEVFEEK